MDDPPFKPEARCVAACALRESPAARPAGAPAHVGRLEVAHAEDVAARAACVAATAATTATTAATTTTTTTPSSSSAPAPSRRRAAAFAAARFRGRLRVLGERRQEQPEEVEHREHGVPHDGQPERRAVLHHLARGGDVRHERERCAVPPLRARDSWRCGKRAEATARKRTATGRTATARPSARAAARPRVRARRFARAEGRTRGR